jgi:ribosomal protein L40E
VNIPQKIEPPANRDHFICPLCQAENRANAKFCRLCGKPRLDLDKDLDKDFDIGFSAELKVELESADNSRNLQTAEEETFILSQSLEQIQNESDCAGIEQAVLADFAPAKAGFPSTLCRQCQAQVRGTDKFCSWCGQVGPCDSFANSLYCPKCQKQLPAQANFCFACGEHVGPHKRLKLRPPGEIFQAEDAEFFPTFDA